MNIEELKGLREDYRRAIERARDESLPDKVRDKAAAEVIDLRYRLDDALIADREEREIAEARSRTTAMLYGSAAPKAGSYRAVFKDAPSTGGYGSFGEFVQAMNLGTATEARAMAESMGSSGGFAVPTQFVAEILDTALEDEIIRPRATIYPMTLDTLKVPAWAGSSHASTLYDGFSGAWLAEGETASRETPALRLLELESHKLGIFVAASSELAADGIGFEDQLARAMVKAVSWFAEDAFINGTGAGQPLGLLSDPAKISLTASAGGANTIAADDLLNMLVRLHPACYKNALWICSSEALGYIWTMKNGEGSYLYQPEAVNGQGRLLGLPLVVSEHASQVGTEGDVILCDPTQYVIGLRKDAILEKTNAASWTTDQVDYRVLLRVDGQGSWESAITPANSGDSLSWVITIGTRS